MGGVAHRGRAPPGRTGPPVNAPDAAARARIVALLHGQRWAGLASVGPDGLPLASQVAYVPEPGAAAVLLHLSTLAAHTRNVLARPHCSLVVSEPDDGRVDPQTLARLTLGGEARVVAPPCERYAVLRAAYLARLPEAAPRFDFADFRLLRVALHDGHYVGGFASAHQLPATLLHALLGAGQSL